MALADFTPETVDIEHNGKPLMTVRGLSLDDVSILIRAHLATLNRLQTAASTGALSDLGADSFIIEVLQNAPDVAYDALALAADVVEDVNRLRKLPVGTVVKALQAVLKLTLEDIGGPLALLSLIQGQKLIPTGQTIQ